MSGREYMLGRLYDRRASLKRVLDLKKRTNQDPGMIEQLIAANEKDIDLFENGSGLSSGCEAAVNAGFIAANGL